jgi:hypothetical protein
VSNGLLSIARLLLAIIAVTLSITAHAQTIQGRVVGISDGDIITVLCEQASKVGRRFPEEYHSESGIRRVKMNRAYVIQLDAATFLRIARSPISTHPW